MKIKNLLSKPIVLSLLFILFLFLWSLLKIRSSMCFLPIVWSISALIVDIIYIKLNKEVLSKKQMTKIAIYSFAIVFLLYIFAMSCVLYLFIHEPLHLVITFLASILPAILIILSGLCTYPALNLGCKIFNPDLSKWTEKTKLKDCLLIIFFTILGMFFYQYNNLALNSLKHPILNYMEEKGYIHKTTSVNLKIKPPKKGINIAINDPIELDFKSKQQVLDIRKKYAAMSPAFIPTNYTPSDTVFGRIEDNKPWWGLNGMMYKGAGQNSIEGLSEESRAINNPLLLFIVDPNFWFVDLNLKGNEETYPKPISITFQPSKKTIYVVYDVTNFDKAMNTYLNNNANESFDDTHGYTLNGLNARDFGYNYAYAYSSQNISYDTPGNNLSTNVQQLHDFIHTGNSCEYPGGCNNRSPAQHFLDFTNSALPAQIGIKLWKKIPANKKVPADIYFIITLQ